MYYLIGGAIFSFLLIYQHTLIKHNDLKKVNIAFFTTNGIASIVFGFFVVLDILI
jgi:4-hydroxybenzoate polyprenyltransferase